MNEPEKRIDDDGGPAFPRAEYFYEPGMTLGDWYAGQALLGILASPASFTLGGVSPTTPAEIAELAHAYADAMVAEGRKRGDS
ncbi:MAG: hypothetical protein ACRDD1_16490 [Planctomycetia bacterium]